MPEPSPTRDEEHQYAGYGGYYSTPEEASQSIREHSPRYSGGDSSSGSSSSDSSSDSYPDRFVREAQKEKKQDVVIPKEELQKALKEKYGETYSNPVFRREIERSVGLTKDTYTKEEAKEILKKAGIETVEKDGKLSYRIEKATWRKPVQPTHPEQPLDVKLERIRRAQREFREELAEENLADPMYYGDLTPEERKLLARDFAELGLAFGTGAAFGAGLKIATNIPRIARAARVGGAAVGIYSTAKAGHDIKHAIKAGDTTTAYKEAVFFGTAALGAGVGYAKGPSLKDLKIFARNVKIKLTYPEGARQAEAWKLYGDVVQEHFLPGYEEVIPGVYTIRGKPGEKIDISAIDVYPGGKARTAEIKTEVSEGVNLVRELDIFPAEIDVKQFKLGKNVMGYRHFELSRETFGFPREEIYGVKRSPGKEITYRRETFGPETKVQRKIKVKIKGVDVTAEDFRAEVPRIGGGMTKLEQTGKLGKYEDFFRKPHIIEGTEPKIPAFGVPPVKVRVKLLQSLGGMSNIGTLEENLAGYNINYRNIVKVDVGNIQGTIGKTGIGQIQDLRHIQRQVQKQVQLQITRGTTDFKPPLVPQMPPPPLKPLEGELKNIKKMFKVRIKLKPAFRINPVASGFELLFGKTKKKRRRKKKK